MLWQMLLCTAIVAPALNAGATSVGVADGVGLSVGVGVGVGTTATLVSVAALLAGFASAYSPGSSAVTVLVSAPIEASGAVPLRMMVCVPPAGKLTVVLMSPRPPTGSHSAPGLADVQVQVNA